jgi:hypothetical protein
VLKGQLLLLLLLLLLPSWPLQLLPSVRPVLLLLPSLLPFWHSLLQLCVLQPLPSAGCVPQVKGASPCGRATP